MADDEGEHARLSGKIAGQDFAFSTGNPLVLMPTQTRAGYTLWGWRYHGEDKAWHLIATTPPPASAAAR